MSPDPAKAGRGAGRGRGRPPHFAAWLAVAAAANVVLLLAVGSYDAGIPVLQAHGVFKPLQILNGIALLILLFARGRKPDDEWNWSPPVAIVLGLTTLLYLPSLGVNFLYHDWTHRHISATMDAARLFTTPQADGFYRPLGFLSLWVDYAIFGERWWGYHLQSILLHLLNAALALRLYRVLGFDAAAARWACALFALAAVNAEAVVWPAARFDLLATTFALLAITAALRYRLAMAAAAYALALLAKESAFAVPVVVVLIGALRRDWRRTAWTAAVLAAVTAAAIVPRLLLYGGLGGYTGVHFTFGIKTLAGFLTRVLTVPQLAINTSVDLPVWMRIAAAVFAVAAALACFFPVRRAEGAHMAALCALAAALPVVNVVGWTGPSMAGTRYLYLPCVWLFLVYGSRVRPALLALIVAANAAGTWNNIRVDRHVLARAEEAAEEVRQSVRPGVEEVILSGVPRELAGVVMFGEEVSERVSAKLPGVRVSVASGAPPPASPRVFVYYWRTTSP